MLDTRRAIETPEGVDLSLAVAGPAPRALAWTLDVLLRMVGYSTAASVLSVLGGAGQGILLLIFFLGEWLYPVLFEVKGGGATPGKRALGLLVLHDDGTPVGWSASLLRNLVRFADFLPLAYGCGVASMLVGRDFKRLGDLAAGTVVVHRDPVRGDVPALAEAELAGFAAPLTGARGRDGVRRLLGMAAWLLGKR